IRSGSRGYLQLDLLNLREKKNFFAPLRLCEKKKIISTAADAFLFTFRSSGALGNWSVGFFY
ncbi:MAG: hypothetical protein NWQ20_01345, partial [Algoriphagus sp.]|nr:hypothetical protein [Algoriphagus sp.]